MPPRYVYWTILIDGQATAFRARERDELLPTFNQLARKNPNITMRYFARGRLWDSPEQAQWANRNRQPTRTEHRGSDWRPGGEHKDPRQRFESGRERFRPRDARKGQPEKRERFRPHDNRDRPPQSRGPQERRESRPQKREGQPARRPFQRSGQNRPPKRNKPR